MRTSTDCSSQPGWDCCISVYATYHLLRSAKTRTPASSASYHFFALLMDCGLVPFYVFICLYSETSWAEKVGTSGRWRTLFSTDYATNTILYTSWLSSAILGGLHLFSIILDGFLVILFRKISRLPPDMNPLEDNLTSRSASKHKHKNSDMTASTTSDHQKRLSGSTLNLYNPSRLSLAVPDPNARQVPFGQSRANLDTGYSPHTLDSARQTRVNLSSRDSFYQQQGSERTSRADVQRPSTSRPASRGRSRPTSYIGQTHEPMPQRMTSPQSFVSAQSEIINRYSSPGPQTAVPDALVKKQQKQGLLDDNWYVVDDGSDLGSPRRGTTPQPQYQDRPHDEDQYRHAQMEKKEILPAPLTSNPPVPPKSSRRPSIYENEAQKENDEDIGRALTMGSSIYSDSASIKSSTAPKSKYYGNLQAATMGVKGQNSPPKRPLVEHRAISRSGADVADANVMYYPDGHGRARIVSGKAAEEGMGGWGMRKREVSGFA